MWRKYEGALEVKPASQSLRFLLLLQVYVCLFPRQTVQHAALISRAAHNAHAIGHRPSTGKTVKTVPLALMVWLHYWYRCITNMEGIIQKLGNCATVSKVEPPAPLHYNLACIVQSIVAVACTFD